jgi:hypothetical protein
MAEAGVHRRLARGWQKRQDDCVVCFDLWGSGREVIPTSETREDEA